MAREHLLAVRRAKRPFWRRGRFTKRPAGVTPVFAAADDAAATADASAFEHSEPKVPWYKRELGPKKKAKQEKPAETFVEASLADGDDEAAACEPKVPWYKRELGSKKKAKKEKPGEASPPDGDDDRVEPKVPWYKRELGSKKKAKKEKPVEAPPADGDDDRAEPKVPWYKRELGSKKQPKQEKPAETVVDASLADSHDDAPSEPRVPWYKREVGRKKAQPIEVEAVRVEADQDEPTAADRILAATQWETPADEDVIADVPSEPAQSDETSRTSETAPTAADAWSADETSRTSETAPTAADAWSAFFGDAVITTEPAAQHAEEETLVEQHTTSDVTVDVTAEADPIDEHDAVVETEAAAPKVPWYKRELGGKKKQARVVEDEVVAPSSKDAAPKVPWYKRELGGKKKQARVVEDEVVAPSSEDAAPKVPWYKRELGAKKRAQRPEVVERAATDQAEPKVPWYKRELGRKKKVEPVEPELVSTSEERPDEPSVVERVLAATERPAWAPVHPASSVDEQPTAEIMPVEAVEDEHVAPIAVVAAQPKVPWYKRDLGSKKQKKEKRSKRAVEAASADEPTVSEPKVPWYKRELGSKKQKKEKQPKRAEAARAVDRRPAEPQVPWYKREIGRKKPTAQHPRDKRKRQPRGGHKKQRIVGLKVGGSQLAAARVVNNGSAELVQLARMGLGKGVVVGGELRDPEALTSALKTFFRENKLPRQGVRLGIGSNRIGVRVVEITGVDDRALLDNAVRFKAQEFLPIPLEQAVLDYHIVDEAPNAEGRTVYRVLVAFAYRELVDRYIDACRRAGIRLSGIDLEAFALLRALGAPAPVDAPPRDAAVIAVAIGHDRSTLAVSDGRICEFTRILEWGGFQLDVAVSRVLDVTPSEAQAVKLQVDLASDERVIGDLTPERSTEVRDAVRRQIELLARELVSSLQFYQSQPGSLGVGEIVITGGTAQLPGLAAELQRLIGVKVRLGDPFARVKVGRRVKSDVQLPSLAVAIGLGIED